MQDSSTDPSTVLQFRQDIHGLLRDRVRQAIQEVLEEELLAALGSDRHERTVGRRGYRHGTIERTVTTREGTRTLVVPRGRIQTATSTEDFRSAVLPRYARRTRDVDEAVLGCYLAGANSRRIRLALKPLLGEQHLSKSAVSRVVARLKVLFATWQDRDLHHERYALIFLDGFHVRVRLAGRVVVVPVLAALGVTEAGQKQLVALQLAAAEATASWSGLLTDLHRRGLPAPLLVVTDGHAGAQESPRHLAHRARATLHDAQGPQSPGRVPGACATGVETRLRPDHLRHRRSRGAGRVRRLCEEVDHALRPGGAVVGGSWTRPPHLLCVSEDHVEVAAHNECAGESESRIPAPYQDPGLVQYGSSRGHGPLRARCARAHRLAQDRWPP